MSAGFGGQGKENRTGKDAKITVDMDAVAKLTKEYKRIKRYMKSPIYDLLKMEGTEKIVTELVKDIEPKQENVEE